MQNRFLQRQSKTETRAIAIAVLSDLTLKILVDHLAVTIRAFDPAVFVRDLQPNPWMAAFAAVTRDAEFVNDLGLGGLRHHRGVSFCKQFHYIVWRIQDRRIA